jgi:hypothetical protein
MDVKMLDGLACGLSLVDSNIESVNALLRGKYLLGILQNATEAEQLLVPQLCKPGHVTLGNKQRVARIDWELVFHREEQSVVQQDRTIPLICQRTE